MLVLDYPASSRIKTRKWNFTDSQLREECAMREILSVVFGDEFCKNAVRLKAHQREAMKAYGI